MKILLAMLCLLTPVWADELVRLSDYRGHRLNVELGPLQVSKAPDDWQSAIWRMVPSGANRYTMQNSQTGEFLAIVEGKPEMIKDLPAENGLGPQFFKRLPDQAEDIYQNRRLQHWQSGLYLSYRKDQLTLEKNWTTCELWRFETVTNTKPPEVLPPLLPKEKEEKTKRKRS